MMRPDARQKSLMERLVCLVLFVGAGWLLFSKRKEAVMARIIEFYVPAKFQRSEPLISRSQKGKVIVLCSEAKKPA